MIGQPGTAAGRQAGVPATGAPAAQTARLTAALDWLKADARTEPAKVAAIGYCFGGTVALELGRSGADVAGNGFP